MQIQNDKNNALITNLSNLLSKGNAHVTLDDALKDIPFDLLGKKPAGLSYSIWQLAEHIRIAQWDILEFSRDATHISPKWPDGYWPSETGPESKADWEKCIHQIKSDRKTFTELLTNAGDNIYKPFDYGNGQSLLREALLLADHNSYHTGQIIVVRRLLNDWKK